VTTISCKTILRSRNASAPDNVLSTLLLRYPRCIHAEFMTHRMLSKNSASSRAIPVAKLIQSIKDDPFVPLHWGKNQKGMQAFEELNDDETESAKGTWLAAMEDAVMWAEQIAKIGAHKQIVNRLIEPWMHITVLASGMNKGAWSNFLALRDHKDAEPHMAMLAREVRKCLDCEDDIQTLQPGQWHLPFVNVTDEHGESQLPTGEALTNSIKLSVARCASTSYKTVDGFDMTLDRAIALHDKLVSSVPLHASPAEHVAQADEIGGLGFGKRGWFNSHQHGNFLGFRQYRKMLPGECV
jgi:hypothetical protein